jgi:hypothetical protein
MTNNHPLRFPALSVKQTHRLLNGVSTLPLSIGAASRIRSRVLQKAAPKSLARNRLRKTLVSIAACLLAIVIFFAAFPKAALAVSEFFGRVFTPSRYMNQDPSERTAVPSIDEAIAAAAPQDGDYTIVLLPDLPDAQRFIDYRSNEGFVPFETADWEWIYDIRPEIAEVLYDGNQLIWNTNLFTSNEHVREFMECFGVESGSKQRIDALMGKVTYTVAGSSTVYPLNVSGHGITPIFDEAALATADHAVLYSDFWLDEKNPLPDGVLTITQTIELFEVDTRGHDTLIAFIYHTFTFDTTKGNTPIAKLQEGDIPLSGETYLTIEHTYFPENPEDYIWTIKTKKVTLDGVVLHAEYEYLPTGISVVLTLSSAPPYWTEDMINGLLHVSNRSVQNTFHKIGNVADLYINGEFVSEAPRPDSWGFGEQRYILPIYPDQYAGINSISLKLTHIYYETMNGTNQISGEIFSVPEGVTEIVATFLWDPLVEIIVPIPKN